MPFEYDHHLDLHPHVELELRTESCGSSRETTIQWSAVPPRALADDPGGRLWSDFGPFLTRPLVMLVVGRTREAAGPSRVCHEASVELHWSNYKLYYEGVAYSEKLIVPL